jgi:chromosome segregation ATPase
MLFPRLLLQAFMKLRIWLLSLTVFGLFTSVAVAQSRAPLPTLTTDDVIGSKPAPPAPSATAKEAGKTSSEKTVAKDSDATASTAASVAPAEDPKKKAEKEWNERLKKAQEKQRDLERRADQVELQITQLRNQLFSASAKSPEMNGQINARISELTGQRNRLRAEAQAAQQDVATLESEGHSNAYQVMTVSLTNEKGEPDAKAYQAEQEKLQNDLRDAQARIEVLRVRLNSVQAEVLKKGNGDNFTLNRLRQEREQLTIELRETQTKIETLKNDLNGHRQKANAAGVLLP